MRPRSTSSHRSAITPMLAKSPPRGQRCAPFALPSAEPYLLGAHDVREHVVDRACAETARDRARLVQLLGTEI
jgi:hypothetical protein